MAMLGLGFEIAAPVLLLLFVGWKLDAWLGTGPWLMVAGMLLGMIVGFYNLVRRVVPSRGDRDGGGK
jgi:ATP synthase protein I